MAKVFTSGGRRISISSPGKVLFGAEGITKAGLAAYYRDIAPVMLGYLKDRPLAMKRYPDGIEAGGLFQKQIPDYFPEWIGRATVPKQDGETTYVICRDRATLIYLAGQACITPHVWMSRVGRLDYPDQLVLDLDPPGEDFGQVRLAAGIIRGLLDRLKIKAGLKTTGSRGLHVVIPLDRSAGFDRVRNLARKLAGVIAGLEPEKLTVQQRRQKRSGRVFIDWLRNSYAQTAVAPYAVRARPEAPVAAPVDWAELEEAGFHSRRWNITSIFTRLERSGDPWQKLWDEPYAAAELSRRLKA